MREAAKKAEEASGSSDSEPAAEVSPTENEDEDTTVFMDADKADDA